jgi:thioredoxin reductase
VPGLRERWGREVLHCPYCHGWEVRDRAIGVLAGTARSVHQALLFRQLSVDVTYFTHTTQPSDDTVVPREVVAVATRMIARAGFLTSLGLQAVDHPSGAGQHLPVDPLGRTDVPGVWAAGNVSDPFAQVGAAAAAGAFAGAQINADLVTAEAQAAVDAYRASQAEPVLLP